MLSCKAFSTVAHGQHSKNIISWYYYYHSWLSLICTFKFFLQYFKAILDIMSFHIQNSFPNFFFSINHSWRFSDCFNFSIFSVIKEFPKTSFTISNHKLTICTKHLASCLPLSSNSPCTPLIQCIHFCSNSHFLLPKGYHSRNSSFFSLQLFSKHACYSVLQFKNFSCLYFSFQLGLFFLPLH